VGWSVVGLLNLLFKELVSEILFTHSSLHAPDVVFLEILFWIRRYLSTLDNLLLQLPDFFYFMSNLLFFGLQRCLHDPCDDIDVILWPIRSSWCIFRRRYLPWHSATFAV